MIHTIKIECLPASVRLRNVCYKAGVDTVGDLLTMTTEEILSIRNFGDTTMIELDYILHNLNFSFLSTEERGFAFEQERICIECKRERTYDGINEMLYYVDCLEYSTYPADPAYCYEVKQLIKFISVVIE